VKADAVRAADANAPVDADEALWAADIEGLPISCEKAEALETGNPSEGLETAVPGEPPPGGVEPSAGAKPSKAEPPTGILNRVEKTHTFKRKDERLRLATRVAAALLLVLIVASVVAGYVATDKALEAGEAIKRAGEAEGKAIAQELNALLQTARAEVAGALAALAEDVAREKTQLADEKTKLADEKTKLADAATLRADEQTRRAEAASRRATEQELSARRNLARSSYVQAQADAAADPLRALAWAESAMREAPAGDENRSSYMLRAVSLVAGAPRAVVNTTAGVDVAAVSPDGGTVAIVTETGRFSVWDARTGAPLPHPLPDPNAESVSIQGDGQVPAFSPDGRLVALPVWTAAEPGEKLEPHLLIWEARTGKTVHDIGLEGWASERDSSAHSPAFADGKVPAAMTFSPDGAQFIIFNDGDEGMHVWDVASGEQIEYEEPASARDVRDSTPSGYGRVSRNPARNWFLEVTTDENGPATRNERGEDIKTDMLRVRDIKTGGGVKELVLRDKKRPIPERVRFADFTRDAQKVVVTSEAGDRMLLRVWNVVSGRVSEPVVIGEEKGATADEEKDEEDAAMGDEKDSESDDGKGDKKDKEEEVEGDESEGETEAESEKGSNAEEGDEEGDTGGMRRLYIDDARGISPDGRSLLLIRTEGDKAVGVEVWDISGDEPKSSTFQAYEQRHYAGFIGYEGGRTKAPVNSFYADDGEHVIDVSSEYPQDAPIEVSVWNLQSGLLLNRPLLVPDGAKLVHISTRDKTAAVAYGDGTLLTWAIARDGSLDAAKPRRPPARVSLMLPTPDWGSILTSWGNLELRDAKSWAVKWQSDAKPAPLFTPKFSDDGTRLAVVSGLDPLLSTKPGTLQVYRASDGKVEPGFRPIAADGEMLFEFSRDGGALVTKTSGSRDGDAIKRWSAKTGEPLPGPSGELMAADATFLDFTRYGEFCMTSPPFSFAGIGLGSYTEFTLRRVDEGLTPVARLRFAEHRAAALAAALFRGAKEIRPTGPDSVVAVLDSGVEVSVVNTRSGAVLTNERTKRRLVPPLDSAADPFKLVISPDGRLIAAPIKPKAGTSSRKWESVSRRTFVRVWDAATGLPLSNQLWHEGALKSLTFSPDGRRLMTATEHGTLRDWFFDDFAGRVPPWAAHMGEALGGMRVAGGLDAQRLPAKEHSRSRSEFEAALARAAASGDEAARFLLEALKR
ncbi:MAG TPA: WD40 repeat domain-containing protein, partial [Pyrinomonadaceae bacterium]